MGIDRRLVLLVLFVCVIVSGCAGRARDLLLGEKISSVDLRGQSYSVYSPRISTGKTAIYLLLPAAGFSSDEYLRKWISLLGSPENVLIAPDLSDQQLASDELVTGLEKFVNSEAQQYHVPKEHIFLIGESNGAILGYRMIGRFPELFRMAVMISGAIDQKGFEMLTNKANLIRTEMLMVHGTEDSVFKIQTVEENFETLKNAGVKVELRVVPGMGHGSDIFTDEKVVSWFKTKIIEN